MLLIIKQWQEIRRYMLRRQAIPHLFFLYIEVMLFNPQLNRYHLNYDTHSNSVGLRNWFPQVNFYSLNPLNLVRVLVQCLGLLIFRLEPKQKVSHASETNILKTSRVVYDYVSKTKRKTSYTLSKVFSKTNTYRSLHRLRQFIHKQHAELFKSKLLRVMLTVIASLLVLFTIQIPMNASSQFIMLFFYWGVALWARDIRKRSTTLLMVVLSVLVSCRYIYWRITETIYWDALGDSLLSLVLLSAELYAWSILIMGYIQTVWPLHRNVASLPLNAKEWPSIDVFIPSYNEPLSVVRPTVLAAQSMDWPKDKLNIYLLDDGNRRDFSDFASQIGVNYIAREDNTHAKAGNLNNALKQSSGDYVVIFDCDHIPTRAFLQLTLGWFLKDEQLALLQTPHHFFSPDPFEKNLMVFRDKPNEGELFYGLIQDGNDIWNASFFCGSCAVLKRGPLEEIGGIAVETVTEDAHTALKLHRKNYRSAYLNIPLAAGLATESLSAHIGQRIRWARGMAQIFRLDNPLIGKGLSIGQRICYSNAMLYFLNGLPRLIFMLAPLAFLLLHTYIVFAPALMIALYALPHLIHAYLTSSRLQGRYRHSFWAEMYETVLAWYIFRPTLVALIAPSKGKFNVTEKGGLTEKEFFDWEVSKPYLLLVILCMTGFLFGLWRLFTGPADEYLTVIINLAWISYNLIILGGAVAVAEEAKQVRVSHRVNVEREIIITLQNEKSYRAQLKDFSDLGAGLSIPTNCIVNQGETIHVLLDDGPSLIAFNAKVVSRRENFIGVLFEEKDVAKQQALLRATFSRADAWVEWRDYSKEDKPISSFKDVVAIGFKGYKRMVDQILPKLSPLMILVARLGAIIRSLLPQRLGEKNRDEYFQV